MIDSITIAETGLQGYEQALQTISNNTANMNTPGFKGETQQFADLANGDTDGGGTFGHAGLGLRTLGTSLDFAQGQFQSTNDPLDLAVNGKGYFTLKDSQGELHYTKDGQFKFDASGNLVSKTTGEQVMALDAGGALAAVSIAGAQTNPPKTTTKLAFTGILSSTATGDTVGNLTVIDTTGASHALSIKLTPVSGSPGQWSVALMDGTTTVGTQTLAFNGGQPVAGSSVLSFQYTPAGGAAMPLTLDFSSGVTSFDTGASSTLALASQDGYAVGKLTGQSFDGTGTLVLTYSNGQTSKQQQLALAQFDSPDQVEALGSNLFRAKDGQAWHAGVAGGTGFGNVQSSEVEGSNVDLSREFSNLVIMQRGYQACSQVVSTASDMLTALFGMMPK